MASKINYSVGRNSYQLMRGTGRKGSVGIEKARVKAQRGRQEKKHHGGLGRDRLEMRGPVRILEEVESPFYWSRMEMQR